MQGKASLFVDSSLVPGGKQLPIHISVSFAVQIMGKKLLWVSSGDTVDVI
jgi:hypothetical protein